MPILNPGSIGNVPVPTTGETPSEIPWLINGPAGFLATPMTPQGWSVVRNDVAGIPTSGTVGVSATATLGSYNLRFNDGEVKYEGPFEVGSVTGPAPPPVRSMPHCP